MKLFNRQARPEVLLRAMISSLLGTQLRYNKILQVKPGVMQAIVKAGNFLQLGLKLFSRLNKLGKLLKLKVQ